QGRARGRPGQSRSHRGASALRQHEVRRGRADPQPCRVRRGGRARAGRDLLPAGGHAARRALEPASRGLQVPDVEVLLLTDRLDEWAMQFLDAYRGKPFKDVARGSIDLKKLGAEQAVESEPSKEEKHLLKRVKRVLRERVQEVRFSERLTESAACLVIGDDDIGPRMRELLKAAGHDAPETAP